MIDELFMWLWKFTNLYHALRGSGNFTVFKAVKCAVNIVRTQSQVKTTEQFQKRLVAPN